VGVRIAQAGAAARVRAGSRRLSRTGDALTTWVDRQGLSLYPHQDEAIIELLGGSNIVLATQAFRRLDA
jgi:hypothetical protein